MAEEKKERNSLEKALKGLGIGICVILIFVLLINVTIIIKSYMYPDKIPDFFGYKPFIVLSGSMEPEIYPGDLIVTKTIDPKLIKEGDVISFRVENDVVVSHRVTSINNDNGLSFLTKGDANTGSDITSVSPEDIEGLYLMRIGGIGKFALFLQTPIGMLLFVVTPLCLFIVYDVVSRNRRQKKKNNREAELELELQALKAGISQESKEKTPE